VAVFLWLIQSTLLCAGPTPVPNQSDLSVEQQMAQLRLQMLQLTQTLPRPRLELPEQVPQPAGMSAFQPGKGTSSYLLR
jgi:hypothetical protein